MVACKTIGEYKRNQEKIKKFGLEEAKQLKAANKFQPTGDPRNTRTDKNSTKWSPAKVRRVATQNRRRQQQKTKGPTTPKDTTNCFKQSGTKKRPRKSKTSPGEVFEQRSMIVALQNCKIVRNTRPVDLLSNWTLTQFNNPTTM